MKWFFTFLLLLIIGHAQAQQQNVWVFGEGGLNFNSGSPVFFPTNSSISMGEAGTSVCDKNGQLLFFTRGDMVWDRNYNPMPNGALLSFFGSGSTGSCTQGALIVPVQEYPNQYYVFSLTHYELLADAGRLYYSVVDMSLNGGLGDVVPTKKNILVDSNLQEKMCGIAGTNCNVWVVTHARTSTAFKAYEVNAFGVNNVPVISNVGSMGFAAYLLGTLTPSPNGRKILASNCSFGGSGLELFDFDPGTGILSNPLLLDKDIFYYSGAFSPDQSKVYGATFFVQPSYVFQYDLTATDPASTKIAIGATFSRGKAKLGPDNKIYFQTSPKTIGCVNNPNAAGVACAFDSAAIILPSSLSAAALPNIVPAVMRDTAPSIRRDITVACWQAATILSVNGNAWDFNWDDNSNAVTRTVNTSGRYVVSYKTPPCVYHSDTFIVRFLGGPLPTVVTVASCNSNKSGSAFVKKAVGDTNIYSFVWRDAAAAILSTTDTVKQLAPGKYTLRIISTACDTTLDINIVHEIQKVSFTADTLACTNTPVSFKNTSGSAFTNYLWSFGDGNTTSTVDPQYSYVAAGNYTIMLVGNGSTCTDTIYRRMVVDTPLDDFKLTKQKDSICVGQSVVLIPKTDSTTIELKWGFDEGIDKVADKRSVKYSYDRAGDFTVRLSAKFRVCPEQSYQEVIHVYPLPLVDIGLDTSLCPNEPPITLFRRQAYQSGERYSWNTGETSERIMAGKPATYALTVTSKYGCATTDEMVVARRCYLDIPNAFSPNGDGANDYFFPRQLLSKEVSRFHMQVFNRWGQLLFETNTTDGRGWDGTFNGVQQSTGVYIYTIEAKIGEGDFEKYQGNVTLLR